MFNASFHQHLSGELSRYYSVKGSVSAGASASIEEAILPSATTTILMPLDVSKTKLLALMSTVYVTVKINSEVSPTNTFALLPNTPFIWVTATFNAFLDTLDAAVTTDFVTLHVVNTGSSPGVFYADALYDPTV